MHDEQVLMQYLVVNAGENQIAALGEGTIVYRQAGDGSRVASPGSIPPGTFLPCP